MRIDETRTGQEQIVANLIRALGFSIKTDYRPKGREFDVFAVLGPLTIAVECKDYTDVSVGVGNIEEFSIKLQDLGNVLGVFVANRFSSNEIKLCEELGIAYLTTNQVEDSLKSLRERQSSHKHLLICTELWNLLTALKTFVNEWIDYINDWIIQDEIRDTKHFEKVGLIRINRSDNGFVYNKTEDGRGFFNQFLGIRRLLEDSNLGELQEHRVAAAIIYNACSWDNITIPGGGWGDRVVLTSLGIHNVDDFKLTSFGCYLNDIMLMILDTDELV